MVPMSLSLPNTSDSIIEVGGMILPIVISLYEWVRGRASAMRISLEVFGIGGFGNNGSVKVGSMAVVNAKG